MWLKSKWLLPPKFRIIESDLVANTSELSPSREPVVRSNHQSYINTNKHLHKLLRNELWTSSQEIWLGKRGTMQEKSLCLTHWGYKVHFQGPLSSSHPIPTIQTKLSEFQVLPHGAWCDAKGCIHHNYYVHVPKHYLNLNTPWDLTTGLQKYREEGPCRQTGVAKGDDWHSVLRSDQQCDGAGQGLLTPEIDYRTACTRGGSPSQTQKDSPPKKPRVSTEPEAISAAASTVPMVGFQANWGLLSRDTKTW